jgi:hypothetical protein
MRGHRSDSRRGAKSGGAMVRLRNSSSSTRTAQPIKVSPAGARGCRSDQTFQQPPHGWVAVLVTRKLECNPLGEHNLAALLRVASELLHIFYRSSPAFRWGHFGARPHTTDEPYLHGARPTLWLSVRVSAFGWGSSSSLGLC